MGTLPRITTQRCMECGVVAHHYHHHQGYAPEHHLTVQPLCRSCHSSHSGEYAEPPPARVAPVVTPPPLPSAPAEPLEVLRVTEVAAHLDVKPDTVRRWLSTGRMKGTFLGGRRGYLILPSDVRRFVEENRWKAGTTKEGSDGD